MKNLKLSNLETQKLNEREMGMLHGGTVITVIFQSCTCSCYYADQGGSSIEDNRDANHKNGQYSGDGDNEHSHTTITVTITPTK